MVAKTERCERIVQTIVQKFELLSVANDQWAVDSSPLTSCAVKETIGPRVPEAPRYERHVWLEFQGDMPPMGSMDRWCRQAIYSKRRALLGFPRAYCEASACAQARPQVELHWSDGLGPRKHRTEETRHRLVSLLCCSWKWRHHWYSLPPEMVRCRKLIWRTHGRKHSPSGHDQFRSLSAVPCRRLSKNARTSAGSFEDGGLSYWPYGVLSS